jgi:hypothetical protein
VATELIQRRWCDYHLREKDEKVEGVEFELGFRPTSEKGQPLIADLCQDCADRYGGTLLELIELLASKRQGSRTPTPAAPSAGEFKGLRFDCPLGCDLTMSKSGMNAHVRDVHQMTLAEVAYERKQTLEGRAIEYVCPVKGCKAAYDKGQGYASHVRTSHPDMSSDVALAAQEAIDQGFVKG